MSKKSNFEAADELQEEDFSYDSIRTGTYNSGNNFLNRRSATMEDANDTVDQPVLVLPNDRGYARRFSGDDDSTIRSTASFSSQYNRTGGIDKEAVAANNRRNGNPNLPPPESEEELQDHKGLKSVALLLFIGFLAGMLLPVYLKIPFAFGLGSAFTEGVTPVLFGFFEIITGITKGSLASIENLSIFWLTFGLAVTLILALATLISRKNTRTTFCLECAAIVAAVFVYLQFLARGYFVVDLVLIIGGIALLLFIVQSLLLGGRNGALNLLCLVALLAMILLSLTAEEFSIVQIAKSFLLALGGSSEGLTLVEIFNLITMILLIGNLLLTVLQMTAGKQITWFTFGRYAFLTVFTLISLLVGTAVTGVPIYDQLGLCVFILIALVLTVVCLFICLMATVENKKGGLPQAETVMQNIQENPVAPATPYGGVNGNVNPNMPNIYINLNTNGTTPVNASDFVQITGGPGQNGTTSLIEPLPEEIEEPEDPNKQRNKILSVFMFALSIVTGLGALFFMIYNSALWPTSGNLGGFLTFLSVLAILGTIGCAVTTFVLGKKSFALLTMCAAIAAFLFELLFQFAANNGFAFEETGELVGKIVVLLFALLTLIATIVAYTHFTDRAIEEEEEAAAEREATLGKYHLMGESFANEQATRQQSLAAQTAPIADIVEPEETEEDEAAIADAEALEEVEIEEEAKEETETVEEEEVPEEPVEEIVEEEIEDDDFMRSLTPATRAEFRKVFLGEDAPDFLPAYQLGEDNTEFFNQMFIYLTMIRSYMSDDLLTAVYDFMNP